MAEPKRIVIVAGPNGAGKTTFAQEFLPREAGCPDFINADLLAAGLSPFDPERAALRAGRLMLEEIHRRVRQGKSFAFETTMAGRNYARWIPRWRAAGYHVKLVFLSLPTADLAMARGGLPCEVGLPVLADGRSGDGTRGDASRQGRSRCAGNRRPTPV